MGDVLPRLELALELAPELDQPGKLAPLDTLLDGGVERSAERDVHGVGAELDALGPDERRHVPEPHGADASALDVRPRLDSA